MRAPTTSPQQMRAPHNLPAADESPPQSPQQMRPPPPHNLPAADESPTTSPQQMRGTGISGRADGRQSIMSINRRASHQAGLFTDTRVSRVRNPTLSAANADGAVRKAGGQQTQWGTTMADGAVALLTTCQAAKPAQVQEDPRKRPDQNKGRSSVQTYTQGTCTLSTGTLALLDPGLEMATASQRTCEP